MAYYFKLPTYNNLNAKQKVAILEEKAIAITGSPGTGKTVVSIWRHMNNYIDSLIESALLTYTKSLHFFITQSIKHYAKKENNKEIEKASKNIFLANSWNGKRYQEIIIDEAQDLPENELVKLNHTNDKRLNIIKQIDTFDSPIDNYNTNDIYRLNGINYRVFRWRKGYINYIKNFSAIISYGADNNQIIYPERAIEEERLKEIFPNNKHYQLFINYRNTYEILLFVKKVLPYDIPQTTLDQLKEGKYARRGSRPILKVINNEIEQKEEIIGIIKDYNDGVENIAVLVPFVNQVKEISNFLIQKGYKLNGSEQKSFTNYYNENDDFIKINNVHITTFKSSKGLEFDTVIIPYFDKTKDFIKNYDVVNEKDYFVAFTRAERNLFLISIQKEYLKISKKILERE